MSTNLYAPPVRSSEPIPTMPFFKSGTRILFVAYTLVLLAPWVGNLVAYFFPAAFVLRDVGTWRLAESGTAFTRIMLTIGLGIVPVGVWMLGRNLKEPSERLSSRRFVLGVTIAATISVILASIRQVLWFLQPEGMREPYLLLRFAVGSSQTLVSCVVVLLIRHLAVLHRQLAMRLASNAMVLLLLADYLIPWYPFEDFKWWIAVMSGAISWVTTITLPMLLWSARKLEDLLCGPSAS